MDRFDLMAMKPEEVLEIDDCGPFTLFYPVLPVA
jgi:hypothetical protein